MRRPLTWCAAVLAASLVLVACGGSGDDDEDPPGDAATEAAAVDDGDGDGDGDEADGDEADGDEEGSADAAACDDADPVRFGSVQALTGPAAETGAATNDGIEMAVAEVNASGGVLGRCIELLVRDDEGDPTRASQVARELVDQEGVQFLLGSTLSSPAGAILEITQPAGVIQVTEAVQPAAGDPEQSPYAFRTQVSAAIQAETFLTFMEEAGYARAGIVAVNDALGVSVADALDALVGSYDGIEIVATEFHEPGATDQTAQVEAVLGAEPDVLLSLNVGTPDMVATIRGRNALGSDLPVLGFASMSFPGVTEGVGEEGMANVFSGQTFRRLARDADGNLLGPERSQQWLEAYREWGDHGDDITTNTQQPAGGYDGLMMLVEAIEAVGELDNDAIVEHLESNPHEGVRAQLVYTPEAHDGPPIEEFVFVIATSFEDGTYQIAPGQE